MRPRTIATVVVLTLVAAALLLPQPTAAQYGCVQCQQLDFGYFNGTAYFCVYAGGSGWEECRSSDDWCWQYGRCVYYLV